MVTGSASQPAIHLSNQPDHAASPISPCLTLLLHSCPHDHSLPRLFDLAQPCLSATLLHAPSACEIWIWVPCPITQTGYLAMSVCLSVIWFVHHVGPNTSTTIGWIATNFGTNGHVSHRIKCSNFDDPLTFLLVPSPSQLNTCKTITLVSLRFTLCSVLIIKC